MEQREQQQTRSVDREQLAACVGVRGHSYGRAGCHGGGACHGSAGQTPTAGSESPMVALCEGLFGKWAQA